MTYLYYDIINKNIVEVDYMNSNKYIKSMLFGFMLGDGWISSTQLKEGGAHYYQAGFSGDIESLELAKYDLVEIYGDIGKATLQNRDTYSVKYNISGNTTQFILNTRLTKEFIGMGMPVGKRVEQDWLIPNWIMNGNTITKACFMSGFYAAEGYTPAFQSNDKTLKVMGFNFYKRKNQDTERIVEQFSEILNDLGIEFTVHFKTNFTKGENTVIEFRFDNNHKNILKVLRSLDLRYAVNKKAEFESVLEYYEYKESILREIQDAMDLAHEGKLTPKEIAKLYSISVNTVQQWRSKNRTVAKTPKTIITYTEFKRQLSPLRENAVE